MLDRKWTGSGSAGVLALGLACAACTQAAVDGPAADGGAGAGHAGGDAAGSGGGAIAYAEGGAGSGSGLGSGGSAAGGGGGMAVIPFGGVGSVSATSTTLTAAITLHQVASGDEQHHCVVVELPNAQPVWVDALHASLSNGSHHLIVDRANAQTPLMTTSASCAPTMAGDATRLLIAQQHDTRLQLPEGVAYKLEAHQRIFLQLHFINTTDKAEEITGSVELSLATETSPKEAKSIFVGATNITLSPGQPGSATYFGKPPAQSGSLQVFALTSHTHQLGIRSTIERVASANAPEVTPLHESLDWAEPPLTQFTPPLTFDGSDGLRLTCRYMNTTNHVVNFGTTAEDEMCFMWLYYYQ